MTIDDYVEECWDKASEYRYGVSNGSIVTNILVKQAVQRHINDLKRDDIEFRRERVERVFKFAYFVNLNFKNKYQRFRFLPWQAFFVASIYGWWIKKTNKRRVRAGFLFIAKKNGKSSFAALLQLYALMADGEIEPQSILCAQTREQAGFCLNYATTMVQQSPALRKRVEPFRSKIQFIDKNITGFSRTVAGVAKNLAGFNTSFAIFDEVGGAEDDDVYQEIKSGTIYRQNPLLLCISTAGFSETNLANKLFEEGKAVLKGDQVNDSYFYLLYCLDEGDDPQDRSLWIKANPSLGELFDIDVLETELATASLGTGAQSFMVKHLNLFISSSNSWIPDEYLDKAFTTLSEKEFKELEGKECFGGLDLSSSHDLTSLVLLFNIDGKFKILSYFFRANNPKNKKRKSGVDIQKWIDKKYIIESKIKTIDYDFLRDFIIELSKKYEIRQLGYDRWQSDLLIPRLQDARITCRNIPQTHAVSHGPIKYMEKLIYDEKISMGGNPVLKWNFKNVVIGFDSSGYLKFMKNKSKDSIDGAVSTVMALAGWIYFNTFEYDEPKKVDI